MDTSDLGVETTVVKEAGFVPDSTESLTRLLERGVVPARVSSREVLRSLNVVKPDAYADWFRRIVRIAFNCFCLKVYCMR